MNTLFSNSLSLSPPSSSAPNLLALSSPSPRHGQSQASCTRTQNPFRSKPAIDSWSTDGTLLSLLKAQSSSATSISATPPVRTTCLRGSASPSPLSIYRPSRCLRLRKIHYHRSLRTFLRSPRRGIYVDGKEISSLNLNDYRSSSLSSPKNQPSTKAPSARTSSSEQTAMMSLTRKSNSPAARQISTTSSCPPDASPPSSAQKLHALRRSKTARRYSPCSSPGS